MSRLAWALVGAGAVVVLVLLAGPACAAYIWLTPAEIAARDTTSSAWTSLRGRAIQAIGTPDLSNQDNNADVFTLANALHYVRKLPSDPVGAEAFRTKVRAVCMAAIGTDSDQPSTNPPDSNRTLALGRGLAAYIISAQYVGLTASEDNDFKYWLRGILWKRYVNSGQSDTTDFPPGQYSAERASLKNTHQFRPNNWGTMAGASRAAIAVYLDSTAMLNEIANTFHGYLGNRAVYAGFSYDADLSWQCNSSTPVGVNPFGCVKSGRNIDGALPEEMRRGCSFTWPPCPTQTSNPGGYAWEALQGVVAQAEILYRQGYDVWNWQDRAILRAVGFLTQLHAAFPPAPGVDGWYATGDDRWVPWVINHRYQSNFTAEAASSASPGKNVGWTNWTHPACTQCGGCP